VGAHAWSKGSAGHSRHMSLFMLLMKSLGLWRILPNLIFLLCGGSDTPPTLVRGAEAHAAPCTPTNDACILHPAIISR